MNIRKQLFRSFIRKICIRVDFIIFIFISFALTLTLYDLVVCWLEYTCNGFNFIFTLFRILIHAFHMYSLYYGFYGLIIINRDLLKYHLYLLIFTFFISLIIFACYHFISSLDIAHTYGRILAPLSHFKTEDEVHYALASMQLYYQCCGWQSHKDWSKNQEISFKYPSSCCGTVNDFNFLDFQKVVSPNCTQTSPHFHHLGCKDVVNSNQSNIYKFYIYVVIVIVFSNLITLPCSLILVQKFKSAKERTVRET